MVNIFSLFKSKKEDKRKGLTRSTAAVDALNDELARLHNLLLALATNNDHNVINSRTLAENQIKELQKVLTDVAKMPPLVVEIVDT